MLREERERNTSQVRAVLRCYEETWNGVGLSTGQERGRKPDKRFTIQIQGFARRDTGKVLEGRAKKTLIPLEERLSKKQGEEGSQYKEGAKGNILITLDDAQGDQADADE